MKNFRKAIAILAIIAALFVGIVTTAFATEASDTAITPSLEEAKSALESKTPLNQYDLPVIVGPLSWDEGTAESLVAPYGMTQLLGSGGCNEIGHEIGDDGEGHFTIRYHGAAESEYEKKNGSLHTYTYVNVYPREQKNNLVMEFDLACLGEKFPAGLGIEHATVPNDVGGRSQPRILEIKPDGSLSPSYVGSNAESGYNITEEEKANFAKWKIEPGQWYHFSLLYNSETCFVTLYINYEFVATYDTRPKSVSHYELTIFRFGTANQAFSDGEISIDNFVAYEGSYVRTTDLFAKMNDPERFIFYTNYMINGGDNTTDRVTSYNKATSMLSAYYDNGSFIPYTDASMGVDELAELNGELEAGVNDYLDFVANAYSELYTTYISENLKTFTEKVDELGKIDRSLDTLSARKLALNEVNAFLDTVGDSILSTPESGYDEVKAAFDSIVGEVEADDNIVGFCDAVDTFKRAMSFSATTLERHYNNIVKYVEAGIDISRLEVKGYERFEAAYSDYLNADDVLSAKVRDQNAKKIIDCVSFISEYTTEAQWVENYDYINKYVVIIRDVVRENNYNPDAEGINTAVAFFESVDDYFYGLLQNEHAEVIGELLDKYTATDGYIEKMGICAYLDSYVASEDVDKERDIIAPLLLKLDIYKSELAQYKDDYNKVLVQNTEMFKTAVQKIRSATDYSMVVEYYELANSLYFAMNVGDPSIKEELEIYDAITFLIEGVEKACAEFVIAVEALKNASDEDRFAALVDCCVYSSGVELSVEGVAAAMEYYVAERDAYNAGVNAVNGELKNVNVASVGSLRANCGVGQVVAIIVKKLEELN